VKLLRPGDIATLIAGAGLVLALSFSAFRTVPAERLLVRLSGKEVARLDLDRTQQFRVRGPLGVTVVEVQAGRARVQSDPSPRQLCVRQGWLTLAGDAAICLPNEVSVELIGERRPYDGLAY
jgi:hypothetical protein